MFHIPEAESRWSKDATAPGLGMRSDITLSRKKKKKHSDGATPRRLVFTLEGGRMRHKSRGPERREKEGNKQMLLVSLDSVLELFHWSMGKDGSVRLRDGTLIGCDKRDHDDDGG